MKQNLLPRLTREEKATIVNQSEMLSETYITFVLWTSSTLVLFQSIPCHAFYSVFESNEGCSSIFRNSLRDMLSMKAFSQSC